jgi:hypothetical protein
VRKFILIFPLIITVFFPAAAQEGGDSNPISLENTVVIDESYSTLKDIEGEIIYLQRQVTSLNYQVTLLEAELTELRRISAIQGDLLNKTASDMNARPK